MLSDAAEDACTCALFVVCSTTSRSGHEARLAREQLSVTTKVVPHTMLQPKPRRCQ